MISFILPSWNRVLDLVWSIENIQKTTRGHEIEIVVVLNEQDEESQATIKDLNNPIIKQVIVPKSVPNGRPHRCWQLGYDVAGGDWVVQIADDVRFEPGWLDAAMNCSNQGFVAFCEPRWGDLLSIHWMATKEYISTVMGGYFGLTYYYTSWSDNEVKDRAHLANRHTFCANARFVHLNRAAMGRELDIYARIASQYTKQDKATFYARKEAGYPVKWPEV